MMISKHLSIQIAKTVSHRFIPRLSNPYMNLNLAFKPIHTFSTIKNPYRKYPFINRNFECESKRNYRLNQEGVSCNCPKVSP